MPTSSPADTLAEFLAGHSPFDSLTRSDLADLAATASTAEYAAGDVVVGPGVDDIDAVWVVWSGSVDLLHPDDVDGAAPLDTIEPGGLFGFSAMLVGVRTTFTATAARPSVVVRLPGPSVRPVFASPAGVTYLARTIAQSFGGRSIASPSPDGAGLSAAPGGTAAALVRRAAATVDAHTSIRDAVCLMTERGSSCVVIPTTRGRYGIFTDRDLRTRVVAAGVPVDTRIGSVMTVPAAVVDADRTPTGVLLEMLELGVQHMPVVDVRGGLVGVLESADLLANSTTRSFSLRRHVEAAVSTDALIEVSAGLRPLIVDLWRTGTTAGAASGILSVVVDALVRRAVELAIAASPTPLRGRDLAWLSLGSVGRREAMPSSDVDSALSWSDGLAGREEALRDLARAVHRTLDACGLPADTNNAIASSPRFARSASAWRAAASGWLDDPLGNRGIVMSSLLVDGRVVWGDPDLHSVPDAYREMAVEHPEALRLQLRDALATRARVRSVRDVLARRGTTVDLKSHAVSPIVNLARWGGMSVGVACASTPARLTAAAGNGLLSEPDSRVLVDVFERLQHLRFGHQVDCLSDGRTPTDVVALGELTPLERSMVMDAIREIASVQRRVGHVASTVGVPVPRAVRDR
ncbi:cyclic nucleotide-binding domain-containing protein [Rhodococcus sp. BP-241]|uniref:DUF294 nucleotidyltransferase-like domain-containing protein n=1 Tax=Rhodococcus sp. BP-241 TaxID=2739441 RepID=UPI001C9B4333|nr:DUF294 nucleotidyltransferase-like domain-containing protein [Rhodococcus sp. BP-241]MBY6705609.1 cyclic nucleotide-binding domain-containing protein [Rhodococcus sp. BP-241]